MFLAKVYITLKPMVNDPQGLTVLGALKQLGFATTSQVRVGKYLEVSIDEPQREAAAQRVEQMCKQLFANPVIEQFRYELEELPGEALDPPLSFPAAR